MVFSLSVLSTESEKNNSTSAFLCASAVKAYFVNNIKALRVGDKMHGKDKIDYVVDGA